MSALSNTFGNAVASEYQFILDLNHDAHARQVIWEYAGWIEAIRPADARKIRWLVGRATPARECRERLAVGPEPDDPLPTDITNRSVTVRAERATRPTPASSAVLFPVEEIGTATLDALRPRLNGGLKVQFWTGEKCIAPDGRVVCHLSTHFGT